MVEASVGFQCRECVGRGAGRQAKSRFGAPLAFAGAGGGKVAYSAAAILIGLRLIVGLLDLVSGGRVRDLLFMWNPAVAAGQWWRLITTSITSFGLFSLVINSLFLFIIAKAMEPQLGRWRLLSAYFLCGLGSSTVFFFFADAGSATAGGSAALVGLIALVAVVKWRGKEDVRGELVMVGLLVVMGFLSGFGYVVGILGGALTGAAIGLLLAHAPRANRTRFQAGGMIAIAAVCLAAVAAKTLLL